MRKNCQHGQSRWKGTGRQPSQGGDGCDGTCQPQHPNMTNMVIKRLGSWKPGQKWKILKEGGFRNITEDLSETHQRWDICGDDDVLNQLNQDMQLEVKLRPSWRLEGKNPLKLLPEINVFFPWKLLNGLESEQIFD